MIIEKNRSSGNQQRITEITQILLRGIYRLKLRQTKLPAKLNQLDSDFYSSTDNAVNKPNQRGL